MLAPGLWVGPGGCDSCQSVTTPLAPAAAYALVSTLMWRISYLLLFCGFLGALPAYAQTNAAPITVTTPTPAPTPNCERAKELGTDLQSILTNAHSLFVRSHAPYVRAHEVENSLLKHKKFAALHIALTRDEPNADVVLELGHKYLTTRFFFTVTAPCAQIVVASGSVSSLFGTVDKKVADSFIKQVRQARQP